MNEQVLSGQVVWLFGRPGAGKTSLAKCMASFLKEQGNKVVLLDGDALRKGVNRDLGFSLDDRQENIRRSAEMARLIASQGVSVICSMVTPTDDIRQLARLIIEPVPFYLVYVYAPLDLCMQRDPKGHYRLAEEGKLLQFTGIQSPFEEPKQYNCMIDTSEMDIETASRECLKKLNLI